MAIDNYAYRETDTLANTSSKTFYPLRIPVSHWQLRHYISHPEPDILYYASGHDIFALNTNTKKRKLLATLPFEARCTAGGYGWVCVGGEEEGHFAAIKVDGSGLRGDVDAALQGLERRWSVSGHGGGDGGRRVAGVKVERIGDEIVNSISIHRVQDEEAHLDDIVAVLTNNDKTVRVYSLPQGLETRVLDLPFAMNHATISPDGHTMVAVGDVNQAFFFRREILEPSPQIHKPHNRLTSASVEWKLRNVVHLHMSEEVNTMGYFTTAWSPRGQLVAVGSEGGYITVFDVDRLMSSLELDDADAVVAVVPSSRPDVMNPHPGAVRSMTFSPEPWDLLVWAEDQGRICIGDLRTGLKSRQVVTLDPKDESLQRVTFEDLEIDHEVTAPRDLDDLEREFVSRYRQSDERATAVNFANEYIEARRRARQEQRRREQTRDPARAGEQDDEQQGLTAQEQVILENLRTTRQREEARSQGVPRSVNYTTSEMFRDIAGGRADGRSRPGTPATNDPPNRPILDALYTVPDAGFPELSRTNASNPRPTSSHGPESAITLPPLRDDIWRSAATHHNRGNTGLVRLSDGSRLPMRRASVILTPPTTNSSAASTATPNESSNRASASHQPSAEDAEENNPWRTIEEHMSLSRGPLFESAGRVQASSPLPPTSRPTETERQQELAHERAARARHARHRERWHSFSAELAGNNPNTSLGERVDPSTDRLERTLERYTADGGTGTGGQGLRLPSFTSQMSQGGEILLRRGQLAGFGAAGVGGYPGRTIGVRTAGLAMSGDGRMLWAACEEGIFEIEVRVKGRLFWAAVEPR